MHSQNHLNTTLTSNFVHYQLESINIIIGKRIGNCKKMISATQQSPVVINDSNDCTACVIWLHGLGADGHDFVPVINMLKLDSARFILPHAPIRKVTRNNGVEMRAWYDIYGLTAESREDTQGIRQSEFYIESLINAEISRGIPANKIVIAGFSQGGAMALHTALRFKQSLAGVIALSAYLPLQARLVDEKTHQNQAIKLFMAHGSHDEVITIQTCQASIKALQNAQYLIDWHEYAMEHTVCAQEIDDIHQFLMLTLALK